MTAYTYTWRLTDFAEQPFPGAVPRVFVVPERDSFGPNGPLSSRPIPVPVQADGSCSVLLVATVDTEPQTKYTIRCDWFTVTQDGQEVPAGWSEWTFTAAVGGGPIRDMVTAPASVWWIGPPWPATPTVGVFYLNREGQQPWARYEG